MGAAGRALRSAFRRAGFDLLRRHYYSPIPDLTSLPPDVWTRESELPGVRFDAAAGLDFVKRELVAHVAEYAPPRVPTGNPRDFYLENGLYESGDAELLYAMIRRFAPERVIELGSGMSTLVIADALARREATGEGSHIVCDPYPRAELRAVIERVAELRSVSATEIPLAEFSDLQAGDVLFVDTTHTVKVGSEVNRIVLEVLPSLAPGVIVHVHDIYLPWEYPREFMEERNFFWNEQYLLQAFLAFNEEFEVLFGAHALARRFPGDLAELLPSGAPGPHPSALWLRRTDKD
jgi:predicted O-methyltransferase YrrM